MTAYNNKYSARRRRSWAIQISKDHHNQPVIGLVVSALVPDMKVKKLSNFHKLEQVLIDYNRPELILQFIESVSVKSQERILTSNGTYPLTSYHVSDDASVPDPSPATKRLRIALSHRNISCDRLNVILKKIERGPA
jgi:hypothetical protein